MDGVEGSQVDTQDDIVEMQTSEGDAATDALRDEEIQSNFDKSEVCLLPEDVNLLTVASMKVLRTMMLVVEVDHLLR